MDFIDLYDRGTTWTAGKIPVAEGKLDDPTPCDEWNVRALLNHLFESQGFFVGTASGNSAAPPQAMAPDVLGNDPAGQYEQARQHALQAFREPGAAEKAGPMLGIAFVDQLVHGWDIAKATGQDATIPDELAQAAFQIVDGQLTDDRRATAFKPEVQVPDDASAQDKLIGYGGRQP